MCLMGDFNQDLHQGEGDRATALHALLASLGLLYFSHDVGPTWRDRRFDHVVCNACIVDLCRFVGDRATCPWAVVAIHYDVQHALSVDNALVMHELLLTSPCLSLAIVLHVVSHSWIVLARCMLATRPCFNKSFSDSWILSMVVTSLTPTLFCKSALHNVLKELVESHLGTPQL